MCWLALLLLTKGSQNAYFNLPTEDASRYVISVQFERAVYGICIDIIYNL